MLRLRLAKTNEYNLLLCLKHSLWGAARKRLYNWQEGEYLALLINNSLAALAEIIGKPDKEKEAILSL